MARRFAVFPDSDRCHQVLAGDLLTACGLPIRGEQTKAAFLDACPKDHHPCLHCEAARDILDHTPEK